MTQNNDAEDVTLTPESELFEIGIRVLKRLTPDDRLSLFIASICEANIKTKGGADNELCKAGEALIEVSKPEPKFDAALSAVTTLRAIKQRLGVADRNVGTP
jgi:hypothetical protein